MAEQREVKFWFRGFDGVSGVARNVARSMRTSLSPIGRQLGAVGRSAGVAARGIGSIVAPLGALGGAAGLASLGAMVKGFADLGDTSAKTARRMNLSVGAFGELNYWAERNGLSTEEWNGALKALSGRLANAAGGQNKNLAELLGRLGISLRDASGKARMTEDVLGDLALAFEKNIDPLKRNQMAIALFGEDAGNKLVDALSQGKDAMTALREEAKALGLSLSNEDATNAEIFTDSLTNLTRSFEGVRNVIGAKLLPMLTPLIDSFKDWVVANREIIATSIAGAVEKLVRALSEFDWSGFGDTLGRVGSGIGSVVDFLGGWENAAIALAVVMNGSLIAAVAGLAVQMIKLVGVSGGAAMFRAMTAAVSNFGLALRAGYGPLKAFNLALKANPVGAVITALELLIGVGWLVYENWDSIVAGLKKIWDVLPGWAQSAFGGIADVVGGLIDIVSALFQGDMEGALEGGKRVLSGYVQFWESMFGGLLETISGIADKIGAVIGGVAGAFDKAAGWLGLGSGSTAVVPGEDGMAPGMAPSGSGVLAGAVQSGAVGNAGSGPGNVSVENKIVGRVDSIDTTVTAPNQTDRTLGFGLAGAMP